MAPDISFADVRLIGRVEALPGQEARAGFLLSVTRRDGTRAAVEVRAPGASARPGDIVRVLGELAEGGTVTVTSGIGEFVVVTSEPAASAPTPAAPTPAAPTAIKPAVTPPRPAAPAALRPAGIGGFGRPNAFGAPRPAAPAQVAPAAPAAVPAAAGTPPTAAPRQGVAAGLPTVPQAPRAAAFGAPRPAPAHSAGAPVAAPASRGRGGSLMGAASDGEEESYTAQPAAVAGRPATTAAPTHTRPSAPQQGDRQPPAFSDDVDRVVPW